MPISRGKRPSLCSSEARASASRRACLPPSVPPMCTLSASDCGRSSVGARAELSWQRHTTQCAPRPSEPCSRYRPPLSRNEEASSEREPVALLGAPPPAACLAAQLAHGAEPLARLAQAVQPPFVHRIFSSGRREGEPGWGVGEHHQEKQKRLIQQPQGGQLKAAANTWVRPERRRADVACRVTK